MPRRQANIGRVTRGAAAARRHRENETEEEYQARISLMMERNARSRSNLRPRQVRLDRVAFAYDCNFDYGAHKAVDIGLMDKVCRYCKALKFKNEAPGICCMNRKVRLPELTSPPEPLYTWLNGATLESKHFSSKVRSYNSLFHMTSFGASKIVRDGFVPTFKVD